MIFDEIPAFFQALLFSGGVNSAFRLNEPPKWDTALNQLPYVPVTYTNDSIDYQLAYQEGHGGRWSDLSLILLWDQKPAALWPLSLSHNDQQYGLSSHGFPIMPPIFVEGFSKKSKKKMIKICLDTIQTIVQKIGIRSWESGESFSDTLGLSEWHQYAMSKGAVPNFHHELYLDLSMDISTIRSQLRDRYKSLINSGIRYWDINLLKNSDKNVWQEFRQLHLSVAGCATRSSATWDLQLRDIARGSGFLVYLKDKSGAMVGGGLFSISRDEGSYSVGVYDRTLFDKPLGHVVQYRAIQEMKAIGLRWYKLGYRPYFRDTPTPADKEMTIGDFKQGFASHVFPKYILTFKSKSNE